jgi:hypothetical protein
MINFYLFGIPKHDRVILAFYEGCPEPKKLIKDYQYEPADVAVVFGCHLPFRLLADTDSATIKSRVPAAWPRNGIIPQQRNENRDVVVLEMGYINRGDSETHHYAAGLNGLNGRANFRNKGMPDDRARLLCIEPKPYKQGEHIVLCGQVPWDASVDTTDHVAWLTESAAKLRTDPRPIVFRPHPSVSLPPIEGCEYSKRPLADDLRNAWAVVTFNSNSGVEALLAGVPVFALDEGSMVWGVCNRSLADIESPSLPDRTQWLNDLCYAQWTLEEMKEGLAWKHLFG